MAVNGPVPVTIDYQYISRGIYHVYRPKTDLLTFLIPWLPLRHMSRAHPI